MIRKNYYCGAGWLKDAVLFLLLLVFAAACVPWLENKPLAQGQDMEKYAQERYLLAVEYMKKGRFELARQQFSTASASAVSPELKQMAQNGYEKADKVVEDRR